MTGGIELIFSLAAMVGVVAWIYLTTIQSALMTAHEAAIARALQELHAIPLAITWAPLAFRAFRHGTRYQVQMRLQSGAVVTAVCRCRLRFEVSWDETPWLAAPSTLPTGPADAS